MRHVTERTRRIGPEGALRPVPASSRDTRHFLGVGDQKLQLDLRGARSWDEIVSQVAEAVRNAKPGEWIRGRGWHQEKWEHPPTPAIEGLPLHDELSRVSPDNPVLLVHASGHAAFVNEKVLELAGISAETPDPAGGEILKGRDGRPTGMLRARTAEGHGLARLRPGPARSAPRARDLPQAGRAGDRTNASRRASPRSRTPARRSPRSIACARWPTTASCGCGCG
jgi:predicted amidohydrolase YtcJ